jgi:hypothetical protein
VMTAQQQPTAAQVDGGSSPHRAPVARATGRRGALRAGADSGVVRQKARECSAALLRPHHPRPTPSTPTPEAEERAREQDARHRCRQQQQGGSDEQERQQGTSSLLARRPGTPARATTLPAVRRSRGAAVPDWLFLSGSSVCGPRASVNHALRRPPATADAPARSTSRSRQQNPSSSGRARVGRARRDSIRV